MEDDEVTMACEQGLLENIDWSNKSNADEIDPSQFKECAVGVLTAQDNL